MITIRYTEKVGKHLKKADKTQRPLFLPKSKTQTPTNGDRRP